MGSDRRRWEEVDEAALKEFRGGWCLGSQAFRREMLGQIEDKLGENHPGDLRHETSAAKAERIIAEELARLGWSEGDLAQRRKSDPAKLNIAARLRKETTLPIKEIAARLHLGRPKGAKTNLHKWMRTVQPADAALKGVTALKGVSQTY